jgi:3-isopropylmalate/(R)-2-methylmalate dehydratase small subunit
VVEGLAQKIEADPDRFRLTVDLTNCTVTAPDGGSWSFRIPDADREMLLEGLDSIAVTLKRDAEILAYRERDRQRRPWIYLPERG